MKRWFLFGWLLLAICLPLAAQPVIATGGIVNAASFAGGQPVAPGSLVSIFGTGLAPGNNSASSIGPWPLSLGGVSVKFNNIAAPILYVSTAQINAQVPWNLSTGTASVVVTNGQAASKSATVQIAMEAPAVFTVGSGAGQAIAINLDASLASPPNAIPGYPARAASPGDIVLLYANGLGPVTPAVSNGVNSMDKLRNAVTTPTVLIGGQPATVLFAGLTPQYPGVNQINVIVPQNVTLGNGVTVQIQSGGITSTDKVTMSTAAPQVPQEFQSLYTYLQSRLTGFITSVTQQWDGTKYSTLIGAEMSPADNYVSVVQPNYYASPTAPYVDALKAVGAKVVKFQIGFPLLYKPFYHDFLKDTNYTIYNQRLSYYQQLISDLHSHGIKVIVQAVITPAQGGSYTGDPLNLTAYFSSLSLNDYISGRAANCLTVAQELNPDYINIESEPDTEPAKALRPELKDPATNLNMVQTIISTLESANIPGLHSTMLVSAGMGSWQTNLNTFITNYTNLSGVDVIDIHVHPVNQIGSSDFLTNAVTIADAAISAGKMLGMDEDWMNKVSSTETGVAPSIIDSRNSWSFWSPVDQLFIQAMIDFAYWKHMTYLSFSVPNSFFAYVDYEDTPGCPTPPDATCSAAQWNAADSTAVNSAIAQKSLQLTPTGQAFVNLTK